MSLTAEGATEKDEASLRLSRYHELGEVFRPC